MSFRRFGTGLHDPVDGAYGGGRLRVGTGVISSSPSMGPVSPPFLLRSWRVRAIHAEAPASP